MIFKGTTETQRHREETRTRKANRKDAKHKEVRRFLRLEIEFDIEHDASVMNRLIASLLSFPSARHFASLPFVATQAKRLCGSLLFLLCPLCVSVPLWFQFCPRRRRRDDHRGRWPRHAHVVRRGARLFRPRAADAAGDRPRKDVSRRPSRQRRPPSAAAEQQAGDEAFEKADYRRAIDRYRAALEGGHESRDWVRRQILAQIVWCQQTSASGKRPASRFCCCWPAIPRRRTSTAFRSPGSPASRRRPRAKSQRAG